MSFDLLTLLLEHAPVALAMFDRRMCYLAASRRWIEEHGLQGQEILGRSHYELCPHTPAPWREIHRRGLAGEVVSSGQDHASHPDGSPWILRWEVRPWMDACGEVGGIVIFTEDITETRRMAEEIKALNTDLERRVAERTAELTALNRDLDHFAFAVSHDLRAPLRAMGCFAKALVEDFGLGQHPSARAMLNQIEDRCRRMEELVEGILTLSRCGRGDLKRDQVDVSALVRALFAELGLADPHRRVETEIEPGLQVGGDPRMVEAVMRNLVENAWKYTGQCPQARIRVHGEERQGRHWICVADNGAGFDMACAGSLFQPFKRLHRQDEFPGLGIGLATVQRIVERHGGEIRAQGEPGAGATFRFTLTPSN
jgi:PAS domain S-box-containing protein